MFQVDTLLYSIFPNKEAARVVSSLAANLTTSGIRRCVKSSRMLPMAGAMLRARVPVTNNDPLALVRLSSALT
jgi:hypothetical protein